MSVFQAVNTTLTVAEPRSAHGDETTTPTTPRPAKLLRTDLPQAKSQPEDTSSVKTPTRDSFAGIAGQRPLPDGPFTPQSDSKVAAARDGLNRESSHRSTNSVDSVGDVEMKSGDHDASDNESVTSESNRPSKKKKGQRFFCTEFPPCQLSFTRSEHLARHIRKHTGERPFQCHCSRRFSRLDNLRQHAQTVHVNEDIPGDSLAATGTRFQRQIRTDRVRPPASRARASTFGSQGSHSRGHSRNLSSSSIASISTVSSIGDDLRSRPSSLILGDNKARNRLSLDTYNSVGTSSQGGAMQQHYAVDGPSASGHSTPTSTTFSAGPASPRYPSGLQSPTATVSRSLAWDSRGSGRRLSVPSANPFQAAPSNSAYPPPYLTPLNSATGPVSGQSSIFGSPTSSAFTSRRGSTSSNVDYDWRRRTWHPGTHTGLGPRPGASGLSFFQTPDSPPPPLPLAAQTTNTQIMRLPGIESFDHAPPQPSIMRQSSPMQLDPPIQPPPAAPEPKREERRGHASHVSWDLGINRQLNKLDLANATPPREAPTWPQYQNQAPVSVMTSRQGTTPNPGFQQRQQQTAPIPQPIQPPPPNGERVRFSDQPVTPRKNKRHAWYNGPLQHATQQSTGGLRTSPEDSSSSEGVPTPLNSSFNDYNPAIRHSNGYLEQHPHLYNVDEHQKVTGAGPPPAATQSSMDYGTTSAQPVQIMPSAPQASQPTQQAQQAAYVLQSVQGQRPQAFTMPNPQPAQLPHRPALASFGDMGGLEALAAVAAGEGQVAGR